MGLALEHLTLARKHPSQDARRRGWRGLVEVAMPTSNFRIRRWSARLMAEVRCEMMEKVRRNL